MSCGNYWNNDYAYLGHIHPFENNYLSKFDTKSKLFIKTISLKQPVLQI